MKITSRRSIPSWMWKYWKQVWCLSTREMKGKGWEVSRSEDGGLRRPLLEEGRWPGSHMPWMLDGEEKKRSKQQKLRVLWEQKRFTKSEDTSTPPSLPQRHHLLKKLLFSVPRRHTQTEKPAARTASPATAGHSHAHVRHFGGNRRRQAHARSVGAKEFLVMKRN